MCKLLPDICQIVTTPHTHAVFCLRTTAARGNDPWLTREFAPADSTSAEQTYGRAQDGEILDAAVNYAASSVCSD